MAELYSRTAGLRAIGLRFFTVYGEGGRPDMYIFNTLKRIWNEDEVEVFGDGSMQRDFTYVGDIVNGIVKAMNSEARRHTIFNLGNEHPVTLTELIKVCERVVGKDARVKYKEKPSTEVSLTYANTSKALNELQWNAEIDLSEGVKKTWDWLKKLPGELSGLKVSQQR